eukprot:Gb_28718 [translate_table: standard]
MQPSLPTFLSNVGPSNVVQVITDDARVCKDAGLLVEARYKNIFWTPCTIHSLNLILKKIGKIEWIKIITDEAKEIEMFITNHHMAQAIYRQFASLELLKVGNPICQPFHYVEATFGDEIIIVEHGD